VKNKKISSRAYENFSLGVFFGTGVIIMNVEHKVRRKSAENKILEILTKTPIS
jgi:hypothetical protein